VWNFCNSVVCRHRGLVEHFGQQFDCESCGACDVCLGELDQVEDPLTIAQKILSCVVRLDQQFGGDYTAKVLLGSNEAAILQRAHNRLTTWGLLAKENKRTVRDWIEQLVAQGFLKKAGDYNVLHLTSEGRQLLRGEAHPKLLQPAKKARSKRSASPDVDSWEGVDRELFEQLRQLRYTEAQERQLPPYMIFDDVALREMARRQPTTLADFHQIRGVGEKKLADFGEQFTELIGAYRPTGE
jgi:ATP-dependent DNA helicase RecQ